MAKPIFQVLMNLRSLIEHLTHVKRYSDLVSQHCVPLQLDQKVYIHGLIQYKWLEHWLAFMATPVFQVLMNLDIWSLIEHLTHMERYSDLVSQHCVPLQLDQKVCTHGLIQYKWLEHWLALMAKPVFEVLRSLGRSAFMGEKVSRWCQSALQHCVPLYCAQKSLYSWFHQVQMVSIWTSWHTRANCLTRFRRTLWYTW